ncbi:hypothetical protein ENSA5_54190 [Enhygromyxa salina]|uniref:Uncharacterized protein n=1 Tax=Enhygromyxa salina TaxID=215803 RepID=A0A2S9XFA3_9BACT|nr:hypothetical protein [Enhygromyxa salina]PRP91543.1 hypothetical protein ENSA5_54190 [Enhygromyxa salina]
MSGLKDNPPDPSAAPEPAPSQALVNQLVDGFRDQLRRALDLELRDEHGTTALAFVDHYLGLLRDEDREPIISLVAAGAGAWFGELVRREIGGTWIGDGSEPRRLRLLLAPQFVHFSPVDVAYEAIFSGSPDPGDPRLPHGAALDAVYHLRKQNEDGDPDGDPPDHEWIAERLAEAAPVPEDQFYSLTGRFETLEQILELLAGRALARGREPTRYHLNDYVAALTK